MIRDFVSIFIAGLLSALFLWTGMLLVLSAALLLLRGTAPRVPLTVGAVAAVCLAAGAAAPALS